MVTAVEMAEEAGVNPKVFRAFANSIFTGISAIHVGQ